MSSNGRYCAISYITHTYLKGVIVTLTAPEGLTNPVLIPGAYTSYTTFGSIRSRAISLAIIPSLSKVVVMLDDGSIKVTGVHGGKWVDSIEGANGGSIGSLHSHAFATSSDDRWLADWHTPGAIRVWKVTAEPPISSCTRHLRFLRCRDLVRASECQRTQRRSTSTARLCWRSQEIAAQSGLGTSLRASPSAFLSQSHRRSASLPPRTSSSLHSGPTLRGS
ncbi:hypothetical protein C8Q80DRAFT_684530 [Daedaleopsis nitida]|nr:hypothetical protein C8Q80DRAFT_684530 [Daedaleopsis nitida]